MACNAMSLYHGLVSVVTLAIGCIGGESVTRSHSGDVFWVDFGSLCEERSCSFEAPTATQTNGSCVNNTALRNKCKYNGRENS